MTVETRWKRCIFSVYSEGSRGGEVIKKTFLRPTAYNTTNYFLQWHSTRPPGIMWHILWQGPSCKLQFWLLAPLYSQDLRFTVSPVPTAPAFWPPRPFLKTLTLGWVLIWALSLGGTGNRSMRKLCVAILYFPTSIRYAEVSLCRDRGKSSR